ncbi:hypothetical protein C8F04DRAFT_1074793 [Mycena alexandri]|uniref:EF-hand domain-containing protein n=1 Tax=Mycena alexandri TaxID=1745969 RepID=A0AAD6TAC5_9AGAR|nr:hypothetical protein C8F04DRAFT_1074793 [Mycena alexandri]
MRLAFVLPFTSTLLGLLASLPQSSLVTAICCPCNIYGTCGDTSGCEAWSCCSVARCNILCCNCDGPCKGGNGKLDLVQDNVDAILQTDVDADKSTCSDRLAVMDVNRDGRLSFLEWAQSRDHFAGLGLQTLAERWAEFDWEGKGYLTAEEAFERKPRGLPVQDSNDAETAQNTLHVQESDDTLAPLSSNSWKFEWFNIVSCSSGRTTYTGTAVKSCTTADKIVSLWFTATGFKACTYAEKECKGSKSMWDSGSQCYSRVNHKSFKIIAASDQC